LGPPLLWEFGLTVAMDVWFEYSFHWTHRCYGIKPSTDVWNLICCPNCQRGFSFVSLGLKGSRDEITCRDIVRNTFAGASSPQCDKIRSKATLISDWTQI
jgi:hypothetical protein